MGSHYRGSDEEIGALSAFINLMRAANSLDARQARRLSQEGLTVSQFGVLEALYHLGPLCQKDLSRKLLKTGGNITIVVDNLERNELVQRSRDEQDKRFVKVTLTPKGARLIRKVLPGHVAFIVSQMRRIPPESREAVRELCRQLGAEEGDAQD